MTKPAIARHIESGRAEARPAGDEEVAAFWAKAVVAYADARLASASLDARLVRAYDAGRIAATAIVRAGGYRSRGGEGPPTGTRWNTSPGTQWTELWSRKP
jgi:hypothetical protein